jgi:tetratricopeptide (TPR) repeat protein
LKTLNPKLIKQEGARIFGSGSFGQFRGGILRVYRKFFFLLFPVCIALSLLGKAEELAAENRTPTSASLKAVSEIWKKEKKAGEEIWRAFREFARKGEWEKGQDELEKLYQWKLNQGIRNHYHYAAALVEEAQRTAGEGKAAAIPGLLNYAEKMAPDFAQIYYARACSLWSQDFPSFENISKAVGLWFQSFSLSFLNLEEALPQLANLTLWVISSFLITLAIFSFILLFKYHSFFSHHLKHLIRAEKDSKSITVLGFFLLFIPLLLGAGWMWLLILWLLVFWIYGSRADRTLTVFFLVVLLLLPTGLRIYSSFLVSLTDSGILDIVRANTGVFNEELYEKLKAMQKEAPQDADILQAIGLIEKRIGQFKEAEQRFLQAVKFEPQAAAAFNNLGNIYLITNQTDKAVKAYQKAIQLEPAKTEAYFNLGQAYLLDLLLNEAESEFRRARELRPQLTTFYTSISSRNPNRMAIDQTIEFGGIWRRIFAATPQREELAEAFWQLLWGRVPFKFGEGTAAVMLLILFLVQVNTRGKVLIRNCENCGGLICSRCIRSMVIGNQCSQCVKAFATSTSAEPEAASQKRAEVAKYRWRRNTFLRLFSLLLPGGGHLWRDNSREGIVYLFIFVLFGMKILWWRGFIPSPLVPEMSISLLWVAVTIGLFLLYYGFVQYRIRVRSRERIYNFGSK